MKVYEIRYKANGNTCFVYFLSDSPQNIENKRFYRNYLDCKEQNEKYVPKVEEDKIIESMAHFIALTKY